MIFARNSIEEGRQEHRDRRVDLSARRATGHFACPALPVIAVPEGGATGP
jgi:hypothetical protein